MLHNLRRNITLLLFCLFSICSKSFAKEPELPKAIQGVLDLRKENLQTDGLLLDGEWGFYWNQLLTPDEIKTNPGLYVSFPALWNNLKWKGIELPGQGYATYTLSILLPPNKRSLALDFPDVYTASKLYINGRLYAFSGIPGKTKETTKPRWVNQIVVLPENFDTLKLVLQIANFHHSRGGIVSSFRIGSYHKLFLKRDKQVAVDFIVTAALLMAGLFFFGLYLFGQHDKSILFFALFCITYSYRIVGTGFYALHAVFPDTSWWLNIHIEYLSLYLSIAFFALYTRYLYPDDSNKNILNTQVVLCGIFILITLIFPPVVFTQLIKPFLVIVFFYIGYAFYVFIKAVRNKRMGAGFALAGTGLILCISILINLQYFNFLHLRRTTELFGYISFFFLQSLVLSFRFAYSLKKAKQLAEQGLQVKSQFLSTMSHEIRTPLNSVIGMTHLLLRGNPREEQKEQLNILLFSAGNLLSIVNDILDFNKIEAGKIQFEKIETDIASIARNIISGLQVSAEDKGVKLRLELDPLLKVSVIGDPTRTSQVITNLIHNAIKFTNEGEIVLQIKVK